MVTIEINGIKVEADTLKAAQKLAKKEQARQEAVRKAADAKRELAQLHCYAQIGRWAQSIDENGHVARAHQPIPQQGVAAVNGDVLRIESPEGTAEWLCYGYNVVALIENGGGFVIGAKLHSRTNAEDVYYIATHAIEDVAGIVQVPKSIGAELDKAMQERLDRLKKENPA